MLQRVGGYIRRKSWEGRQNAEPAGEHLAASREMAESVNVHVRAHTHTNTHMRTDKDANARLRMQGRACKSLHVMKELDKQLPL